jgi:hypothetical protein
MPSGSSEACACTSCAQWLQRRQAPHPHVARQQPSSSSCNRAICGAGTYTWVQRWELGLPVPMWYMPAAAAACSHLQHTLCCKNNNNFVMRTALVKTLSSEFGLSQYCTFIVQSPACSKPPSPPTVDASNGARNTVCSKRVDAPLPPGRTLGGSSTNELTASMPTSCILLAANCNHRLHASACKRVELAICGTWPVVGVAGCCCRQADMRPLCQWLVTNSAACERAPPVLHACKRHCDADTCRMQLAAACLLLPVSSEPQLLHRLWPKQADNLSPSLRDQAPNRSCMHKQRR